MEKHRLVAHPDTPPDGEFAITVAAGWDDCVLRLIYELSGDVERLVIPSPAPAKRTDGLWQATCFEAFVRTADQGYLECNFSPSSEWAVYAFDGYRHGRAPADAAPRITVSRPAAGDLILAAAVAVPDLELELGLSAVLEERSGTKSYWALTHPAGKPDFHHPSGFIIKLQARA